MLEHCLIRFRCPIDAAIIPEDLNDPFALDTPEIARQAATELQDYLIDNQSDWKHDFDAGRDGRTEGKGKMFGVLVVQDSNYELGYLCAFSGKLKDDNIPDRFVPSVFDLKNNGEFLSEGMTELSALSAQINKMDPDSQAATIMQLKHQRAQKSVSLQAKLFSKYYFFNSKKESKSLPDIFKEYDNLKPASGAGECAAPKLFEFAFRHKLKPVAIAEFWWGESNLSQGKKQGEFYPACNDKCKPLLSHMLKGVKLL